MEINEELQQKRIDDGKIFYKKMIKQQRNEILTNSDKYLLPGYPITQDKLQIIKQYRQELRDMPQNNFIFPIPPDF